MCRRIAAFLAVFLATGTACGPRGEAGDGPDGDDLAAGGSDAAGKWPEGYPPWFTPYTTPACPDGTSCGCTALGALCLFSVECCSGACVSYTCVPICRPEGSPCTSDPQCCLSPCIAGFCGRPPCLTDPCGRPRCSGEGSPCAGNDQCCSANCVGNRCVGPG